jgi:predicted DNA binding CopG/RHH family protein
MRKHKKLPKFATEKAEREFWRTHDTADYFDLSRARPAVFTNLKPTTKAVSIRLPQTLLARIKMLAAKRDVPYQSLLKVYLAEKVTEETRKVS